MKHIKLFENFLNESISFEKLVDDYKDNPYGLGANAIEYDSSENGNKLILRFEDSYDRNQTIKKLKEMGVKSKHMSNFKQSSSFKYKYELIVSKY